MTIREAIARMQKEVYRLRNLADDLGCGGFDDLADGCERAAEELQQTANEARHVLQDTEPVRGLRDEASA